MCRVQTAKIQCNLNVDFLELGNIYDGMAKLGKKSSDNLQLHLHHSLHTLSSLKIWRRNEKNIINSMHRYPIIFTADRPTKTTKPHGTKIHD
jgi:hypothetical protein